MNADAAISIVEREDDHTVTVRVRDKVTTYYKVARRPLPLLVTRISLAMEATNGWPPRGSDLPELRPELTGRARVHHYRGLCMLGSDRREVTELDVRFSTPTPETLNGWAQFHAAKGEPPPSSTRALIQYRRGQTEQEDLWFVDCWLPEPTMRAFVAAAERRDLRTVSFGVSSARFVINDGYEPADSFNTWHIRPDSDGNADAIGRLEELRLQGSDQSLVSTPDAPPTR